MVILIDMDDVLECLVNAWIPYLNKKYSTNVAVEDIKEWNMSKAFPTLSYEQVYSAEMDDDFWKDVKPMPGADEALRKLIADGHELFVVTATVYETLRSKMENVLFKYFPYLDWSHVIITSHKYLINGDILIDDGPHNLAKGNYHKILFEACHNRSFDESSIGAVRVKNWEEAYEEVCRYAAEKETSAALTKK